MKKELTKNIIYIIIIAIIITIFFIGTMLLSNYNYYGTFFVK